MGEIDDELGFHGEMLLSYYDSEPQMLPKCLWHYTSINGFLGITKTPSTLSFFATHADYLNDSSEGKDVVRIYQKVCHNLYANRQISKSFYELIKDLQPSGPPLIAGPKDIPCDYYIACFSKSGDSLGMWRYYAKDRMGVSLCILTSGIKAARDKYNDANKTRIKISIQSVIYSDRKKKKILSEKILKLWKIYHRNPNAPNREPSIQQSLKSFLSDLQWVCKHPCFYDEKEIRVIIQVPKNEKITDFPIHFRTNAMGLVPYVEFQIKHATDCVPSITISPFQKNIGTGCIDRYLITKGINGVEINISDLPVRF